MLSNYLPILIFLVVAAALAVVLLVLGTGIGRYFSRFHRDPAKLSPYECGFDAFEDARAKFDVRYYLVAIVFIVFDLEIAFLFPWAVALGHIAIATRPSAPIWPSATAQGNRNAISRSKTMNTIATR